MSISVEASEARDSLSDDRELINTYEVDIYMDFIFIIDLVITCQKSDLMCQTTAEVNCTRWEAEVCISCSIIS